MSAEPTPLDERTERLIENLVRDVLRDTERPLGYNFRPAQDALRSHIRELVAEAECKHLDPLGH